MYVEQDRHILMLDEDFQVYLTSVLGTKKSLVAFVIRDHGVDVACILDQEDTWGFIVNELREKSMSKAT